MKQTEINDYVEKLYLRSLQHFDMSKFVTLKEAYLDGVLIGIDIAMEAYNVTVICDSEQ